ncbi:MAG: amidase [Alphaproteobacteria bacterium]|nr:amidase [Alphaproteobacteria bacterium]|tara:strand:+ start:1387 stop:2787 length:1401 start_codon:yes stop_codon:yes gene_type:complete
MKTNPVLFSASELLTAYSNKTLSPVEVTKATLDHIANYNEKVNAFRLVDEEKALENARASEERWSQGTPVGLVDGIPTTIKDLVATKGWSTRRGSLTTNDKGPWDEDAPLVGRLRSNGAVLLGKTTTPEFGWKGVTDSPLTGITRNPWDLTKTPGGSSGGAAAAAAACFGALHHGSDGGGSIRMPSGYTGIYGLKPTFGRVPTWPASGFGTLSHQGPMTRTVNDAALMLTVMSEPDSRDWYALPEKNYDWRKSIGKTVKGWRIAYSPDLGHAKVNPEITDLVKKAAMTFMSLGAYVDEVDPGLGEQHDLFKIFWFMGAARLQASMTDDQLALLDPGFREVGLEGSEITINQYLDATAERESAGTKLNQFFDKYDLLLTPTLPITAFDAGEEVPIGSNMNRWTEWTPFSYPFNLGRHPAASIPCGLCANGLPAGLQLVGPMNRDDKVLTASRSYEMCNPIRIPDLPI